MGQGLPESREVHEGGSGVPCKPRSGISWRRKGSITADPGFAENTDGLSPCRASFNQEEPSLFPPE